MNCSPRPLKFLGAGGHNAPGSAQGRCRSLWQVLRRWSELELRRFDGDSPDIDRSIPHLRLAPVDGVHTGAQVADPQHAITQQRGILLDHCSYTLGDDELLPADRRCGFKGGGIFLAGALVRLGTDRQPFGGRDPAGDCVKPQSPNDAKDSAVMDANMGSSSLRKNPLAMEGA